MTPEGHTNLVRSAARSCRLATCRHLIAALGLAILLVVMAAPATSFAGAPCTDTFSGANHAKWSEAGNWNTGHIPSSEDVVCIPAGVTASLFYASEAPNLVNVREIHGGSLTTNVEIHFTSQPSEGPDTLETLTVIGTHLAVEGPDELQVSHELFMNAASSITGHGTIVIGAGAVGELGEVGCGQLYVNNTKLINRGTLHIGRRYVGVAIVGLAGEAQIINEGTLGIDTQGNVSEYCSHNTNGATIYRYSPSFPYVSEALINKGVIQTEWGAFGATISVPVTNDGAIIAREGALAFSGGSVPTECSTGSWTSSGAQLSLTSGTFNLAPGISLAGVEVTGASIAGCPSPPTGAAGGSTPTHTTTSLGSSRSTITEAGQPGAPQSERSGAPSCVVPKIHAGTTLKTVRRLLTSRHCRLGRVSHAQSGRFRSGLVLALKVHAGRRLRAGAAIGVVLASPQKSRARR
jgi:hypothetical protein